MGRQFYWKHDSITLVPWLYFGSPVHDKLISDIWFFASGLEWLYGSNVQLLSAFSKEPKLLACLAAK